MSRLILSGVGNLADNLTFDDDPDLTPGADEAVVAIEAANINPADFLYAAGWYGIQPTIGNGLGNEGVGRVVEVGSSGDANLVGRRVIVLPNGEQGTWADRVVVKTRNLVVVGEDGDSVQLAQLSVNPLTAHVLLTQFADLKPGDWVGQTIGNSAVGQFVVQLAKLSGYKTLSIVRSETAAEQVRASGGDVVVVTGDGLAGRVAETLAGEQLALVLDGEGGATVGELAQSLVWGGTVVAYSSASGAPQALGLGDVIYREITLKGWWVVNWLRNTPRAELEATYARLAGLLASGTISSTVEATFALANYRAALAKAASSGRTGKILFVFDPTK
jgi:NADPH:quinone reductase-like Zn-dependent oxidoreductase